MDKTKAEAKPYRNTNSEAALGRLLHPPDEEPRWPAAIALLALGGLYSALPSALLVGGHRWLLLIVVILMLVPTIIAHYTGNHFLNEVLGMILNSVVTIALVWSLLLLIDVLPEHGITPKDLLRSAAALWIGNILVFASWYWRLDAGGPHSRALTPGHTDGAFLFPQMTMSPELKAAAGEEDWSPNFIDYLFLAFNTSTAFSPTDTPPLSRWAKLLMITQAMISLLVIALLAGRAVNIL
ncbi:MAG TPA: hypothetical protein VE135_09655 [Pyrinomonadaceae bacterium]|nr:hypothetical protein [Pyrinomonadaceae bacterium]